MKACLTILKNTERNLPRLFINYEKLYKDVHIIAKQYLKNFHPSMTVVDLIEACIRLQKLTDDGFYMIAHIIRDEHAKLLKEYAKSLFKSDNAIRFKKHIHQYVTKSAIIRYTAYTSPNYGLCNAHLLLCLFNWSHTQEGDLFWKQLNLFMNMMIPENIIEKYIKWYDDTFNYEYKKNILRN
jgi:hypothetical protein